MEDKGIKYLLIHEPSSKESQHDDGDDDLFNIVGIEELKWKFWFRVKKNWKNLPTTFVRLIHNL